MLSTRFFKVITNNIKFQPIIEQLSSHQKTSMLDFSKRQYSSQKQFVGLFKHHHTTTNIPYFLTNKEAFKSLLHKTNPYTIDNYVHDHFIFWLSAYAANNKECLQAYFNDKHGLEPVCRDFISFCFNQGIDLDPNKTLKAFDYHNQLSDVAVKNELNKIKPKDTMNLLGYGLDEGIYEKHLASYLLSNNIANKVNLYGFDPYATKTTGISYLSSEQLINKDVPLFDLVTARWVLHHVELKNRWSDFINCINQCNPGANILIVEHGYLKNTESLHKKNSDLLNAAFDIVANFGFRREYMATNFFVQYLEPKDFSDIKNNVKLQTTQDIYDVGPNFPNQTICAMKVKPR